MYDFRGDLTDISARKEALIDAVDAHHAKLKRRLVARLKERATPIARVPKM